ncbi:tyrosine-type recombinase/integrase [Bifidobacterium catenulatum]|uniref:tyrosine-type recombinase/integrase n=1 Tax=Bifidobacterium catenulatum TaxID=1686 RepID=UPI00232EB27B|nr:site-specific integrase [Bifidobacterium catenulatum]MDB6910572.1 tyrosine-type recombinase/integrase [Bifidobacterium catenulatum]
MAYTIRQYATKSGKRYEVRYRKPDGTPTGKRGFRRKMDADAWGAANVTTAKSVGAYIDPQAGRRLVEDFWRPWLAAKKTKAKPSYVKSLEDAWRVHVMPQWGVREVQSITRGEVQRWVTDLAGRRSASVTIRAENLLRNLLERAKEDKCIHDNPCDNIELPRKQRRRHVYLAADELSRVALRCGWREPIVLTLGLCGMRWGEMCGLRVEDVDYGRRRIHVRRNVTRIGSEWSETSPKSHEMRDVPMPSIVGEVLLPVLAGKGPSDWVFRDHLGRPPRNQSAAGAKSNRTWFVSACRRAGVEPLPPHDLRHTAASIAVHAGANIKALQRMLGHKSAAMTLDVYADLFDSDLDDVARTIDAAVQVASRDVGKMWAQTVENVSETLESVGVDR